MPLLFTVPSDQLFRAKCFACWACACRIERALAWDLVQLEVRSQQHHGNDSAVLQGPRVRMKSPIAAHLRQICKGSVVNWKRGVGNAGGTPCSPLLGEVSGVKHAACHGNAFTGTLIEPCATQSVGSLNPLPSADITGPGEGKGLSAPLVE